MKRDDAEWTCADPSTLERGSDPRDARACPAGKVPTTTKRAPLREKARLAVDALRSMFRFVEGMRSTKSAKPR